MTVEELKNLNWKTGKNCLIKIDYHLTQATSYKEIYKLTKNRKGIYKVLNTIALRMNGYHYKKGRDLAISNLENSNRFLKEFNVTEENIEKFVESIMKE